jgi:hypothetical protein
MEMFAADTLRGTQASTYTVVPAWIVNVPTFVNVPDSTSPSLGERSAPA